MISYEYLNKFVPKRDANYYKVVSKNNRKVVYGYSMRTNKLKELIKLNKKGRIESKQIFEDNSTQIKECHWVYTKEKEMMIITKECDDNSKNIKYYRDDGGFSSEWKFENNRLIELIVPGLDENTNHKYEGNGTLIGEWNIMPEGDMCIPFKPYSIEDKKEK